MGTRAQNEAKFDRWEELPDGQRRYFLEIHGREGGTALYVKEVDSQEETLSFRQEIYDAQGKLTEIHWKYPLDKGHQKV